MKAKIPNISLENFKGFKTSKNNGILHLKLFQVFKAHKNT